MHFLATVVRLRKSAYLCTHYVGIRSIIIILSAGNLLHLSEIFATGKCCFECIISFHSFQQPAFCSFHFAFIVRCLTCRKFLSRSFRQQSGTCSRTTEIVHCLFVVVLRLLCHQKPFHHTGWSGEGLTTGAYLAGSHAPAWRTSQRVSVDWSFTRHCFTVFHEPHQ